MGYVLFNHVSVHLGQLSSSDMHLVGLSELLARASSAAATVQMPAQILQSKCLER